jgi:hypothetical protein
MRVPVCLIALAVLAGCAKQPAAPAANSAAPAASFAAAAPGAVPAAPSPALTTVSGTILETMDASEYTYMRLKTATGEVWAAVNKAKVAKGESVTVANAMVMDGFQSKTLNRTFDRILFGVLATPGATAATAGASAPPMIADHKPATAPATQEEMAAQHGQAAGGPPDAPDVKVPKAAGSNSKTIAELWAQRTALKGKEIAVQAKVVKVNAGVMGRNWYHVRDGSGSKATKDNDLTVTSDALAKVGDVVTVTGIVAVDKDFGAGYVYPVIVENARLK